MKQIYIIRQTNSDTEFVLTATLKVVNDIVSMLSINTDSVWTFTTSKEQIEKYNNTMESDDYKSEIEKITGVYIGLNLRLALDKFHRRLQIVKKPAEFELFQKFEL